MILITTIFQINTIFKHIVENWKTKLKTFYEQGTPDLQIYYNSLALFKDIIDEQVTHCDEFDETVMHLKVISILYDT